MAVQTTVSQAYGLGFAGMLADNGPHDAISRFNRQGAAIPFGLALVKGSGDQDVALPSGSNVAADFLGVAEFTHAYKNYDLSAGLGIPVGGMVDVLRKGRVLVTVEVNVAVGDSAFFRISANGGLTQLGAFRNDADSAHAVAAGTFGAKFLSAASAGGLAILDLNLP